MRTIIAGSRGIKNPKHVWTAIADSEFEITQVISGGAKGVDQLAIDYADWNGIDFIVMEAEWDKYGKSAGYIRNQAMADIADALVAVWDGESPGTSHMIDIAIAKGLQVYVHMVDKRYE